MKKIPTLFERDFDNNPRYVTRNINPVAQWVIDGEGVATRKYDGTCCLVDGGTLFKRRELQPGQTTPVDFILADEDKKTGKKQGWVPVGDSKEDQYHREAFRRLLDKKVGTYELVGPKVQGNPEGYEHHTLIKHSDAEKYLTPRNFEGIKAFLKDLEIEGLVWHHPDGRMVKIKRRDFNY